MTDRTNPSAQPPEGLSAPVEDYLKAIFSLDAEGVPVRPGALAEHLVVTPASVSNMLRRLGEGGLVGRGDDAAVELTDEGRRTALRVVRRHRLVETFLVEVLNVPWDEVHAEAERLEHAVSEQLEERIAAVLGDPDTDPHGDPIPPRDGGAHVEVWGPTLADAPEGAVVTVARVRDHEPAALRYLGDLGIRPATAVEVVRRDPFGGPTWVRCDGGDEVALGEPLTRLVHTDDAGRADG